MFVDEKRLGEAPQPVLGLADFVSWLEMKDPTGCYDFMNYHGNCLIGQYLASRGISWINNGTCSDVYAECSGYDSNVFVAALRPWTFGSALERARKALENKSLA